MAIQCRNSKILFLGPLVLDSGGMRTSGEPGCKLSVACDEADAEYKEPASGEGKSKKEKKEEPEPPQHQHHHDHHHHQQQWQESLVDAKGIIDAVSSLLTPFFFCCYSVCFLAF